MTYDIIRNTLDRYNVWLLVLETYGINVWCAAGKGTFGTGEVVRRVTSSGLANIVNHRRLILPILGAPGVAAHQVANRCGFSVSYATIRAADLPEYLGNGMITTAAMRQLTFSIYDRLVLIPVEMVLELKSLALVSGAIFMACAGLGSFGAGLALFGAYLGAVLGGIVVGPLLLPWLPTKSFALKGALLGLLWTLCYFLLLGGAWPLTSVVAAFLILPAVSSFYLLSFTGCTTYTSRSGVRKEMKIGLPIMAGACALGVLLLLLGRFI